jgi:hypothetical protein
MKKASKDKLRLERETLASLQMDALDSIVGGNATVTTISRWTHQCAYSTPLHTCVAGR